MFIQVELQEREGVRETIEEGVETEAPEVVEREKERKERIQREE